LTELSWPALSVFRSTAFPPPTQLNASLNASDVLQIAFQTLQAKPIDSMALVASDAAIGDPASESFRPYLNVPNSWNEKVSETPYYLQIGLGQTFPTHLFLGQLVDNSTIY
jgi:hypothetical protein